MRVPKLSEAEIERCLTGLPGWARQGETLRRTYTFASFQKAIAFVNAVAEAAEAADHHPDIDIRHRKVTLTLTTHDAGGLTIKDRSLAAEADRMAR